MCHAFLNDSRFYQLLLHIDQDIAAEVQAGGCSCGGVLHSARYPRKPRGIRAVLDESYREHTQFVEKNIHFTKRSFLFESLFLILS